MNFRLEKILVKYIFDKRFGCRERVYIYRYVYKNIYNLKIENKSKSLVNI